MSDPPPTTVADNYNMQDTAPGPDDYLASDDSSYSTGAEFVADGGMLAGFVNPEV